MWRPVIFLLAEDPIAGLGKMPGDGNDGATVPASCYESLIERADVGVPMSFEPYGAIRSLNKGPFQILVDETRDAAESGVTAAGEHPWHKPRVARQLLGAREAHHIANLQPDDGGENLTDSRNASQ
ncbi:MAG: hypothetical protein WBC67_10895 [Candidatus Acidiferrales bacterium]